jgi:uncharacterized protein YbjT (DUF2867 family)
MMAKKILLVGSTGVVGQAVLQQALVDSRIGEVVCLIRQARTAPSNPKQTDLVVDFTQLLPKDVFANVDALICCIGTTIKIAKTKEAFREVDLHIPTRLAQAGALAGLRCFVLNSSSMADVDARSFYLKTKGLAEQAVINSHIASVVIARPSLLDGNRSEFRLGEAIGVKIARVLNPLLPKHIRSVKVETLAKAMLEKALGAPIGVTILESETFQL